MTINFIPSAIIDNFNIKFRNVNQKNVNKQNYETVQKCIQE